MCISESFLSESSKINHDLNFLYLIARTVLPKDILEGLMYGEDFEEPSEEDFNEIKKIIFNNRLKMMTPYEDIKEEVEEPDYEYGCYICGGYH